MNIFIDRAKLSPFQSKHNSLFGWFLLLTIWTISTTIGAVQAAERVEFGIGPIEFGISVKELETYAKQGDVGKELAPFLSSIEAKDRKYVRQFLKLNSDLSQLQVSQFFYSAVGEKILTYLGDLVQSVRVDAPKSKRNLNSAKAIRTGLISAAADPSGLSLLTFLRKYPAPTMRLNLEKGFEVANKIDKLGKETESAISGVEQLSSELAQSEPKIEPNAMANLASPGGYSVKLQTEILKDARRSRQFTVDFYLPQGLSQPAPVIVLSHGLASDRQHFAAIARHLASHGFVAVTVEHPGSNSQKFKNLLVGSSKEMFDVSEFIDRPKDVSYILDDLGRRLPAIANVQQVGVIGHSFGGYTALALAGATIDFDYLTKECSQQFNATNASLLLQCEALKLPRQFYNFRDNRIKFALAINPIESSIFGPKGMSKIKIPVAIAASSEDVVASAVLEQIKPFSWIVAPERYLFVVRGVGHVTDVRSFIRAFMPSLESVIPDKNIEPLREYARIFVLALVQTHVANQNNYRPYLQAGYAISISQSPNQVSILRSLTPEQLDNMLQLEPPISNSNVRSRN
ncbi:alpha/beta hydrolase [Chamaesiphon sp. VAR_48_metabat_135_sub]|uniref:alpha/beta hydrolase n=1 Tax=Chamaesiphon sp. VAR_48_metabat_135_sub TaxID=2964699 RepID=UPI00286B87FA|nr:alpha/beta hydrolase [Chamaesiphon sp. VAR_48_metabat_135_sub]